MNIITNEEEIKRITDWNKKIQLKDFFVLNTPWAKDDLGTRDTKNLALFIEFSDQNGKSFFWLISKPEVQDIKTKFIEVHSYNLENDNRAKRYKEQKEN